MQQLVARHWQMSYWVVGGDYTDTHFTELAPGAREERLGPFATYREAYDVWSARARATVDVATVRYRIVKNDSAAA
jgi:cobyrinic acid a,c-diamide synthase